MVVAWSLIAFVIGMGVSAWLAHLQHRDAAARRHAELEQLAGASETALVRRLERAALLLRAVQALYATTPDVGQAEFDRAYRILRPRDHLPGLQALAHARRVRDGAIERYVTDLVAPGPGNERLVGLDVTGQPPNLVALHEARDSDRPMLSAPFRLAQYEADDPRVLGIAMRLPVYAAGPVPADTGARRAATTGSLVASFAVVQLVETALPAETREALHLSIDDVTGDGARPLYRSHATNGDTTPPVLTREFSHAGRTWRMTVHPARHAAPVVDWRESLLLPGLIASVLLALLVGSVVGTRQRAIALGARMSEQHRESEARFRVLSDLLPAVVLLANRADGRITYANRASRERLGEKIDRVFLGELFEDDTRREQISQPGHPGAHNLETVLRSANGDRFWANVSVAPVELDGEPRLLMVATDVSEQRQLTEMLSYQASHDALTDLLNRRAFERRIEHALAGVAAGAGACALLFIDLDQFKLINDTSGHTAGDQLLIQLAELMGNQLRAGDVLARLGGDEFGVLATSVQDVEGARLVADRLRDSIAAHLFVWEHSSYTVSASIGVVVVEQHGIGLKELFSQADAACYLAKEAGRNRVHIYRELDDDATRRRNEMEWANRLRWAIDEHRFVLHYQEVWALAADGGGGPRVELLLRFREADGRIVTPGAFMPAAERYGLMPMIDRWVIDTALANFDRLHPSGAGLQLATINLSGATLEDEALAEHIIALLDRHGIAPSRVCFEITETVAVRNLMVVRRFIEQLRAIGCHIALDDFGAGMSSFGYLKSLPADIIKIDGSFIQDLLGDAMSRAIVRAVTEIGHDRGFKVVAEWVTGHAIADALTAIGVDFGQGFGLHIPQPVVFQRGT